MIIQKIIDKAFKFAVAIILLGACSKDSNLPLPDGMKQGASVSVTKTITSDSTICVYSPSEFDIEFDLSVLFESNVASVDLMVAYGTFIYLGTDTFPTFIRDFQNPGMITSISSFPSTVNVNIEDIIAAIDAINDTLDLNGGDDFTFFLNITTTDGSFYPGYLPTGEITQSPSQSTIAGQNFSVRVPVVCSFIRDLFIGTYNVMEVDGNDGTIREYVSTVVADPANPFGLIVRDLWIAPSTTYITIDPLSYEVKGEDQFITDWSYYSYGRVVMADFNNGYANTCDLVLFWNASPQLEIGWGWWYFCDYKLTRISD